MLVLNADRGRTLAGHGSNGDCNNQRMDRPYGAHGEPAAENDKLRLPSSALRSENQFTSQPQRVSFSLSLKG